jgi:hypothetical protein
MKQVLKYPGAKSRIVNWIVNNMPKHTVYLEPYAGSLAVLFNKPRCHIETVNDLHGEVVNFFRVLRDNPDELKRLIELTPYSREEYDLAYQESDVDVERARRFCVRCWQGFGCANLYHNGFKSGQQTNSPNPAKAWAEYPDVVTQASKRLKGVQIENLPAIELIKRYNTSDVFIYADPPYLHSTRKRYLYKYEMTDADHLEMLKALADHLGPVMISGYENDLYNSILEGWRKIKKDTLAEAGVKREEVLWLNYADAQLSFEADFPEVMP